MLLVTSSEAALASVLERKKAKCMKPAEPLFTKTLLRESSCSNSVIQLTLKMPTWGDVNIKQTLGIEAGVDLGSVVQGVRVEIMW